MTYQLHHGDCLNIMPLIERESVDAVICDPPYGLGFMGKDWDHGIPGMHFWLEALRCAKPGAYLLAFGGTRTFHRLAVAIEDAGWEIRDTVMWVYGQGFPKSHDVSKAIDREAGAEREVISTVRKTPSAASENMLEGWRRPWAENHDNTMDITSPSTPAAAEWDGWGTALKPAWEPIIVARKPIVGTVAENVQRYGTGGLNIDACRIEMQSDDREAYEEKRRSFSGTTGNPQNGAFLASPMYSPEQLIANSAKGRWPANLIHDGSAEVLAEFPMTTSNSVGKAFGAGLIDGNGKTLNAYGRYKENRYDMDYADTGSAARFFYCAKASKADRDEGLEGFELHEANSAYGDGLNSATKIRTEDQAVNGVMRDKRGNHHPTVKPTALMRYLCRLVTPPNGVILDPFMGSGSTGKAAMLEGFNFIGIDTEIEYVEIAARRIEHACEKVGIVVDQPMMFETRRETVDRPKQLILL